MQSDLSSAESVMAMSPAFANLGGPSVPGAVPSPANLRACFAADGNALDVVSSNAGTLVGSVAYGGGRFGSAFDILGLFSGVDVPSSASLNFGATGQGMTMAAWIYPRGTMFQETSGIVGAGPIVEYVLGAHIWHHNQQNDPLTFFANIAEGPDNWQWHILQATNTVPLNTWSHVAATYDKASGVIKLFVNGTERLSQVHGTFVPATTGLLHIGRRTNPFIGQSNFSFNGAIDEVQLYDRGLTNAEVGQLAAATGTMCVPPPASYQVVTMPPGTAESGVPLSPAPQVAILDANDNIVSNATTPVTATITSGGGTLTGTTTVNAVNGVATFSNLVIAGGGNVTIGFTAAALPAEPGFPTVSPPVASTQVSRSLAITTQPGGALSGSNLAPQPVVEVRDAAGLRVIGATDEVTAAIGSGPGGLSGTATVAAVNGIASFSGLAITGPGVSTLAFSSPGLIGATSNPVSISGLPAAQMGLLTQPAGGESGFPFTTQPVVEVRDATGARAVLFTGPVTAQVVSGSGALVGTTTVNAVAGVATFPNLQINGFGTFGLRFTSGGLTAVDAAPLAVVQMVRQLAVIGGPTTIISDVVMTPAWLIEIRDGAGIKIANSTMRVRAGIGSGSATMSGTIERDAVAGVATFPDLVASGLGAFTTQFWALGPNDTYPAFVVSGTLTLLANNTNPSTPTQLSLLTAPSASPESGVPFGAQPVVELKAADGSRATAATGTVTVTRTSGTGALLGTTTVNVVNGLATFTNLQLNGAGGHTLSFAYGTLAPVTAAVTVTQVPRQLVILAGPTGATSGIAMTPAWQVEIRDAAGLKITTATTRIRATVASGTASLAGGVELDAAGGVATFPGIIATGVGPISLRFATLSGTPSVVSAPLTLLPPPFAFVGFFAPIDNLPAVNKNEGGSTIPIKFSLGTDQGMNIFAPGYPASQNASCTTWLPSGPVTQISVPGGPNGVTGDANILAALKNESGNYHINWKTDKAWDGTCRILLVKLTDGITRTARFTIK